MLDIYIAKISKFQFTPPVRGATIWTKSPFSTSSFQFTPPQGERLKICKICSWYNGISIHAPAKGATMYQVTIFYIVISIHAPTRGATIFFCYLGLFYFGFQFTPPQGERPFIRSYAIAIMRFQFTPPQGERLHCLNARIYKTLTAFFCEASNQT